MFYQNILSEISPYTVNVITSSPFGEHRHGDIEVYYCIKDRISLTVNKKTVRLSEGELILIRPMAAHSLLSDDGVSLMIVAGVSLLKNFFAPFSTMKDDHLLLGAHEIAAHPKLSELLFETVDLCQSGLEQIPLLIRGNVYKLCAYLIGIINARGLTCEEKSSELKKVSDVEKALEMIYYEYSRPLTVEEVAAATGYGKSNFCKIFKQVTGDTFHNVLNRKRIQSACDLLRETNMQISEIGAQVGLNEPKTFCRVFKALVDKTPGEYRKCSK